MSELTDLIKRSLKVSDPHPDDQPYNILEMMSLLNKRGLP